jgi:hypothetical protein
MEKMEKASGGILKEGERRSYMRKDEDREIKKCVH